MLTLFAEGGFPMWFLLFFGVVNLASAARFAARPEPWRLRLTAAVGLTTFFTTLTAICADFAAVGHHASTYLARHPELSLGGVLLQGAAESMAPAIVGFTLLSLTGLIVALGFHRQG